MALVNVIIEGGGSVNKLLTRGEGGSKTFDFMITFFIHDPLKASPRLMYFVNNTCNFVGYPTTFRV